MNFFSETIPFFTPLHFWLYLGGTVLFNLFILYKKRKQLTKVFVGLLILPQILGFWLLCSDLEVEYQADAIHYRFFPLVFKSQTISLDQIQNVYYDKEISFWRGRGMRVNGQKTAFILRDKNLVYFELKSGKTLAFSFLEEEKMKSYIDYVQQKIKN